MTDDAIVDTNIYPEGKLNEHDEGALEFKVGIEKGKVFLELPKPIKWIAMTPDMAASLGARLISQANSRRFNKAAYCRVVTVTTERKIPIGTSINVKRDHYKKIMLELDTANNELKARLDRIEKSAGQLRAQLNRGRQRREKYRNELGKLKRMYKNKNRSDNGSKLI